MRVRQQGKSFAHPLIVLLVAPNETGRLRVAVAANRYLGNAVQRNRIKRRLREAIRPLLSRLAPGYDLLFLARHKAAEASFQELANAVQEALRRARLMMDEDHEP